MTDDDITSKITSEDREHFGAFKRDMVEAANENQALMDGTTDPVVALIDGHDVVMGVWPDPNEPDGVGMTIIKGAARLWDVIERKNSVTCTVTAICCLEEDQALGARLAFGDAKHQH